MPARVRLPPPANERLGLAPDLKPTNDLRVERVTGPRSTGIHTHIDHVHIDDHIALRIEIRAAETQARTAIIHLGKVRSSESGLADPTLDVVEAAIAVPAIE
jgi:hypothetical protein